VRKSYNIDVRKAAVYALGEINDTRAVNPLIGILMRDNCNEVREVAAYVLGEINDTRALYPLIQVLKEDESCVREEAAYALGKIKDKRAIKSLLQEYDYWSINNNARADKAWVAAWAIDEIQGSSIAEPTMMEAPESFSCMRPGFSGLPNSNLMSKNINHTSLIELLIQLLKDEDASERTKAASTLGEEKDARAVDALIPVLLSDKDEKVRAMTAWALGEINDQRAERPLRDRAINDESPEVQKATQEAIRKMAGTE